jgi:hypothetical protein
MAMAMVQSVKMEFTSISIMLCLYMKNIDMDTGKKVKVPPQAQASSHAGIQGM